MTSRLTSQRVAGAAACVAIFLLIALIGALWTGVCMGFFSTHPDKPPKGAQRDPSDNKHYDPNFGEVELVKPMKTSPGGPNEHNLLYGGDIWAQPEIPEESPPLRHHSGHFRHKMAAIWDPHPQYEFTAFGKLFHLMLQHDSSFVLPSIQVTHVWRNKSRTENPGLRPDGCFYSGKVLGDPASSIAVSLCHGMTGHIRTSTGSYFIEPVEKWVDHATPIMHKFYRVGAAPPASLNLHPDRPSNCAVDDTIEVETPEDFDAGVRPANETIYLGRRGRRAKRSPHLISQEYFVELMVVADRKMAEYHGSQLDFYILTLMSVVALIYKDPSIGNPISITVVKLFVLKELEFSNPHSHETGVSANEMLRKFCQWQQQVNDDNDDSPNHHDSALLLTRENLCRNGAKCGTLGLAEVGTMCSKTSSCAIVQDNGLSAAFTLAHELGHVLSMTHDDDHKCSPYQGSRTMKNVMSRMLDNNTFPWSWSNCSRHHLTEFLDAEYGSCLLDKPKKDILNERGVPLSLPGENYTEDDQCELLYGPGSKICSFMPVCKELWCTAAEEKEGCQTLYMPWADGTPCGNGFWCKKGSCVPQITLKPVDGGWGEWQRYGECSRTCGGGVKKAKRDCNNPLPANGGKYCLGHRVRYRSCNTKECSPNAQDFREQQCAKFNNANFNIPNLSKNVQWLPKYGGIGADDRCKLYCRVVHSSSYYLLKDKVIDGTVCGPDTFDICVNGVCRLAGCNHQLGSSSQLDYCGECNGNNSSCQLVTGKYNKIQYGYTRVLRIPAGSSNLDVKQIGFTGLGKDDNFLALVDGDTGKYVLNGNFIVTPFPKLMVYGGTTLEYSGADSTTERINSSRPLTKDLVVEVLSVGNLNPPDVLYQYTVQHSLLAQYVWELSTDWSTCDKVCNGEKRRLIKCVRVEGRQEVSKELCKALDPPYSPTLECNNHCELAWEVISQSECSSHCGEGTRTLTVQCVQKFYDSRQPLPIQNNSCNYLLQPQIFEPCQGSCDIAHWKYSDWGPCSKTCGSGMERRMAECVNDMDRPMNESLCRSSEKIVDRVCNTQKCPRWSTGDWTPCSVTCGNGERRRPYWCLQENIPIEYSYCNHEPIPRDKESCNLEPCPEWKSGPWSQCSVSCGMGKKTRSVSCSKAGGCSTNDKPPFETSCFAGSCALTHENAIPVINSINHYVWRTHKWGPCSVSCGEGHQRRETFCYDEVKSRVTDSNHCNLSEKPESVGICNTPCANWVSGDWGHCSAICGQGIETRAVVCMDDGRETSERLCTGVKPSSERQCRAAHYCTTSSSALTTYKWRTGPWSECSEPCGGGLKSRQVACLREDSEIASGGCDGTKPVATVSCNPQPCIGASWKYGGWSLCNQTCGGGYQHRQVQCQSKVGIKLRDEACPSSFRPLHKQICNTQPCERRQYRWKTHQWGPCSRMCGKGERVRMVECVILDDTEMAVNDIYCSDLWKPQTHHYCKIAACPHSFEWIVGDWSECSHSCGKRGRQVRRLFCYNENYKKKVARKHCIKHPKPKRKRKCNQKQCGYTSCKDMQQMAVAKRDRDYILSVADRNISVYCHNMNTLQPTEYISLPTGVRENYAEIYDCRLANVDSCPGRLENCSFTMDPSNSNAGLTVFEKIRINITTLRVETKDWTFSYQMKGKRVPYGEAGDCYSRAKCPQGRFSINLSGTGLRVSPVTEWFSSGTYASNQITELDDHRKVFGKCGGYCGTCSPINGLKLDVLPP